MLTPMPRLTKRADDQLVKVSESYRAPLMGSEIKKVKHYIIKEI
jgi:hypothetical protein